ncbi:MAG: PQQ-binding-like beta-propeller repeat protein [Planctomycetaceae bacterium]
MSIMLILSLAGCGDSEIATTSNPQSAPTSNDGTSGSSASKGPANVKNPAEAKSPAQSAKSAGDKQQAKTSNAAQKPADNPPADETLTEVEAIEKIRKFNGRANFGQKPDDQSVVGVWYKGPPVTDDGLAYLKHFPKLKNLQVFHLNNVTDAGLAHIAGLTNLDFLRLDGVKATDDGLAHLKGLTKLKTLELMGTEIKGAGLIHIKDLTGLEKLSLSFNSDLTDAALVHLKGLTNLKTLALDDTNVTPAGVDELKKALPNCQILTSLETALTIDRSKASTPKTADGGPPSQSTSTAAGDWPQWRGPNRDNLSAETGLLEEWPENGPPMLWENTAMGSGYSSFVVERDKLFTMGVKKNKSFLIAIDVNAKGKTLWELPIADNPTVYSTPTIDGDVVYALGLEGDLVCAETSGGKEIWRRNIKNDFGGDYMSRGMGGGYAESVLIDGDKLICTPGAKDAMVVCLNKHNGETIWKAAYPSDVGPNGVDFAGFASAVISEACGIRQYVQLAGRGLISVAADDGRTLWTYNGIADTHANIPTPIVSGDYLLASTAQPGTNAPGMVFLHLVPNEGGVKAEEVYKHSNRVASNHHGGMVHVGDYIYMGHGYNRGFPMCMELKTGKTAWRPGRGPGTGSAAVLYADGRIYFWYENGVMALVEATPEKYVLKGKFKVGENIGGEWAHATIAGGCLYVRTWGRLKCYDLKRHEESQAKAN